MALVLSLRKGDDFYVGDERFVVLAIHSPTAFSLMHERSKNTFQIGDAKAIEVYPSVFVSAGEKPEAMIARVAIDAPRSLLIVRGDKRRNPPAELSGHGQASPARPQRSR